MMLKLSQNMILSKRQIYVLWITKEKPLFYWLQTSKDLKIFLITLLTNGQKQPMIRWIIWWKKNCQLLDFQMILLIRNFQIPMLLHLSWIPTRRYFMIYIISSPPILMARSLESIKTLIKDDFKKWRMPLPAWDRWQWMQITSLTRMIRTATQITFTIQRLPSLTLTKLMILSHNKSKKKTKND